MMTKFMSQRLFAPFRRLCAGAAVFALAATGPAAPVNEDEWYDPTDWFDGNNVEHDDTYDWYDYDYNYDYADDWNHYSAWGDSAAEPDYDENYWNNYDWTGSKPAARTRGERMAERSETSSQPATVYTYVLYAEPIGKQSMAQQAQQARQGEQARSGSTGGSPQDKKIARLHGTIEGLQEMNLRRQSGATGPHTIAKIKLENGKTTVASLGRSSQLEDLDLKAGDSIQAVGQKGMIDGETIFVANELRAKGQTIAANPAIRLGRQSMAQRQEESRKGRQAGAGAMTGREQDRKLLKGEVAKVTRAKAPKGKNEHTLVDLRLEDGTTATVDLGPGASLEKIGLEAGDSITLRGHPGKVGGRDVIVADLLKIEGEKVSSIR